MSDSPSIAGLVEKKTLQKRVLTQIENIPSLSTVVGEFLELSAKDYFTALDFEKILIKDQALVARLLKVANSSFFGSSRAIHTVHEAVVLIGMDNLKNIVYAVSSSGLLRHQMKAYRYPDAGFWLHSMAVGMTCRALMEGLKNGPLGSEEAFVAGLLHDIGKLIIDDYLDPGAANEEGRFSLESEMDAAGYDHTELGEKILERWRIPANIREALRHHHQPLTDEGFHAGAAVISLADRICNTWSVGTRSLMDLGREIEEEDFEDLLTALQFPPGAFLPLLWELRQKLAHVEDYYVDDE
ncbi:MAG: HDOD domain-containing protein [Candidatus Krumholzibacteriia bacterium]|nr:HDOD domain-containing protein [bacterium]MCB9515232.1 HDOD domain-containing protein [Candidatus Latescibacterota bacterium]